MSKFIVLVLLGFFLKTASETYKSELVMVIAICRHGMRAPSGTYNKDPFKDSKHLWEAEYGQLTNYGKMQHHNLGQWFRKRYDGFLPKKYWNRDFKLYSSSVDRCIESAAACSSGLYPPGKSEKFDSSIRWQPIPVHPGRDALVHQRTLCPVHTKLLEQLQNEGVFKELAVENKKFFQHLSKMSGEKIKNIQDVRLLYGIVKVQSFFNVTHPEWVQCSIDKMYSLSMMELLSHTYTTELARLRSGPLVDRIIELLDSSQENDATFPKFVLFVAHEGTLVNILNSMKIYDHHWPTFAEVFLIELRRDDKKTFVNFLYKNSTTLFRLTRADCGFACEFSRLKELLAPVRMTLDDWEYECFS